MNIKSIISSFLEMNIQSEEEVRTKLVVPLLEKLGYPAKFRGEEFNVYGYGEDSKSYPKRADFIQFTSDEFVKHKGDNEDDINWVKEHSLLVFESKNVTENIIHKKQPTFYAAWTRSPAFIISNGKTIEGYIVDANYKDRCCFSCDVKDIPKNWLKICELSYENVKKLKAEAQERSISSDEEIYEKYLTAMSIHCEEKLCHSIDRSFTLKRSFRQDLHKKVNHIGIDQLLDEKSAVITSKPGGGKSYLMWMLMGTILHQKMDAMSEVPVILEGRYYGKSFFSLKEGMYKLLRRYVDNVTEDYIDEQIQNGKFYILFDAVDEVEGDLDALQYELEDISQNTESMIILTSRNQNYSEEFYSGFDHYELAPLTDQQLKELFHNLADGGSCINFYQIPGRLIEMLRLPLFLKMFVDTIQLEDCFIVPPNHAALYESYVEENLKRIRCNAYEKELVVRILSQYAVYNYENEESSKEFFYILEKNVTQGDREKYNNILFKSGLICQGEEGVCFIHRTFMEFFYAYHMAHSSENVRIDWLAEKCMDKRYDEIICFLTGILSNRSKQNEVLDYLENCNLYLYVKALKSRRNFKIEEEQVDDSYIATYFEQILNSYANLVETYFNKLKKHFDGYRTESGHLCIFGNMDAETGNISVRLYRSEQGKTLNVTSDSDVGTKVINGDGSEIPIKSVVVSYGSGGHVWGYGLDLLRYGFDSSREIALEIVKKQIIDILSNNVFDDLIPVLLCEDIEQQLKRLKDKIGCREKDENLTLYSNDIRKVIVALEHIDSSSLEKLQLIEKCKKLLSFTDSPINYLNILWDLEPGLQKGYGIDKLYSDNQLVKKIKKIIRLEQEAINEILTFEIPFLRLTERRFRVIGAVWRNEQGAGFQYIKVLCNNNEDNNPVILFSGTKLGLSLENENDFFNKQLSIMGKSEKDIIERGGAVSRHFFGNDVFHRHIYKYIRDKIEKIFLD